jgi:hypothetical protein
MGKARENSNFARLFGFFAFGKFFISGFRMGSVHGSRG